MKIIPTIFARNKKEFDLRFRKICPIARLIQIDFMDGNFVKAKSVPPSQLRDLRKYKNEFEAHLMVSNPLPLIKKVNQKGFRKIIIHVESVNTEKTLEEINSLKLSPWLALNPETKIEKIFPFLQEIDGVLLMGVHPGKEHQKFIPRVYKKIKILRSMNRKIKIQIDGGVNESVLEKLNKLKVDFVNSGSLIANAENPKEQFKKLNRLINR